MTTIVILAGVAALVGALSGAARVLRRLRVRQAGAARELRMIDRLMGSLRGVVSNEEARRKVVDQFREELGAPRVALFVVEKAGRHDVVVPAAASGFDAEALFPFVFKLDKSADVVPRAILERTPCLVRNAVEDWRCQQSFVRAFDLTAYAVLPLLSGDRAVGAILVDTTAESDPGREMLRGLEHFTTAAAVALENAALYERLQQLAIVDGLTEVYNHRHFQDVLRKEIGRATRYQAPEMTFSLLMLDLDRFKQVNDTFGHQTGDAVLIAVARVLRLHTRKVDTVGRYGGEEFAVILPNTDKAGALALADRLREAVAALPPEPAGNPAAASVTVSVGVATWLDDGENGPALIRAADEGLYQAKEAGRNCVRSVRAPGERVIPA
ncbi:MAG: sensor domain-containing diguanylate cyclase [Candidatus Coatesbacteria bacterium]